jgi:ribosomal protein S18 acetylase RimI-like enzyme
VIFERYTIATDAPEMKDLHQLYETTFPYAERREVAALEVIRRAEQRMHLYAFRHSGNFAGFLIVWTFERFRYVEHFAVMPEFRSVGLGSAMIRELLAEDDRPLLLEVEPIHNADSLRRIQFYERLGFSAATHVYAQPPYRSGEPELKMLIMHYPPVLEVDDYKAFVGEIRSVVYEQWQKTT